MKTSKRGSQTVSGAPDPSPTALVMPKWLANLGHDLMDTARSFLLKDGRHEHLVIGMRKDGHVDTVVLDGVPADDWPFLVMKMETNAEHRWVAHICEGWFRMADPSVEPIADAIRTGAASSVDRKEVLFIEVKDEASNLYALIQRFERDANGKPFFASPPYPAPQALAGQFSRVLSAVQGDVPAELK